MQNKISAIQVLSEDFFTQLNDIDSEVSELMDRYTFLFILQELEPKIRYEFLVILDNRDDVNDAVNFAKDHINEFDRRLEQHLRSMIEPFLK